jgi:hypothetical protein
LRVPPHSESLEIGFLDDGETMAVKLWCEKDEVSEGITLLNAITDAFVLKVSLQQRVEEADRQSIRSTALRELDGRLRKSLPELELLKQDAETPVEKLEVAMLENDGNVELKLRNRLKLMTLTAELNKSIAVAQERSGNGNSDPVRVLRSAALVKD